MPSAMLVSLEQTWRTKLLQEEKIQATIVLFLSQWSGIILQVSFHYLFQKWTYCLAQLCPPCNSTQTGWLQYQKLSVSVLWRSQVMALAGLFLVMAVSPSVDGSLSLICLHEVFPWSTLRDRGRGASPHGAVILLGHHPTLCLHSNFFTSSLRWNRAGVEFARRNLGVGSK